MLCAGIMLFSWKNEEDTKDFEFMQQIIERTRLTPDKKIEQIEKCIDLFDETAEKKSVNNDDQEGENLNTIYDDKNNTSKKKKEYYGIKIYKIEDRPHPIKPYYVVQPTFNNEINYNLGVRDVNGVLPVGRDSEMSYNWICLYTIQAEKVSFNLLKGFLKCCKGYHLKFKDDESNWIPMKSQNFRDWADVVEQELNFK